MSIPKNETQLVCIAQFWAKPGEAEKLIETLRSLIPLTRLEGGCIRYELNIDEANPNHIVFVEKFATSKDFDRHCNAPYITNFFSSWHKSKTPPCAYRPFHRRNIQRSLVVRA